MLRTWTGKQYLTSMSTGQFFATRFCGFRFATFLHKNAQQKMAGYMGVRFTR